MKMGPSRLPPQITGWTAIAMTLAGFAAQAQTPPNMPPNELVRKVIANELQADQQDQSHCDTALRHEAQP